MNDTMEAKAMAQTAPGWRRNVPPEEPELSVGGVVFAVATGDVSFRVAGTARLNQVALGNRHGEPRSTRPSILARESRRWLPPVLGDEVVS
jgi:hypothetical protein